MSAKRKTTGREKLGLVSTLTTAMPWLKNKTIFVPVLTSLLVFSAVGVVLAIQATSPNSSYQESEVSSQDDSLADAVAEPVIGPACVEGEEVCEHVKYLLLEANYVDGVNPWGYEELIESIVYQFNVTSEFARAVVDAVEFDWGDDVTASGDGSGSSTGSNPLAPSGGSTIKTNEPVVTITKVSVMEDAKDHVERFSFSKESLIETLVTNLGHSRSDVVAAIESLNVNWNLEAQQAAQNILRQGPFSPERIRGALRFLNFLDSEAEAGVAALGIDEYAQAQLMARDFLMRQTPPCEFSYEFALNYMTQNEYFEEDPASWALLDYLELDENYEDVWLLCGR